MTENPPRHGQAGQVSDPAEAKRVDMPATPSAPVRTTDQVTETAVAEQDTPTEGVEDAVNPTPTREQWAASSDSKQPGAVFPGDEKPEENTGNEPVTGDAAPQS